MSTSITVVYERTQYIWDGSKWFRARDFIAPPLAVTAKLDALIAARVETDDSTITDLQELLQRAKRAHDTGHLLRAKSLALRVLAENPQHVGAAAVVCSILRDQGRAKEALSLAYTFPESDYPPLLTSRAASLCDLGRWSEAYGAIRRVLAIDRARGGRGGASEALAVYSRIKANAPQLFPG